MPHTAYKSLVKAIRNDDYRHWQSHVERWEKKQKEKLTVTAREEAGKMVYDAVLHHAVANLHFEPEETDALQQVQLYFGLTRDIIADIKRPYAPKALKMLGQWFLTDGILTTSELAQLHQFGEQMCLTEAEVTALVTEMEAKYTKASKRKLTPSAP